MARVETFSSGDQYFPNIPNRRVLGKTIPTMFTVCPLRAPSCIQPGWASESMMDELAHAASMDSYEFRRLHTTHDGWRAVLDAAAKAAKWQPRVSASKLSNDRIVTGRGISIAGENHANDDVQAGVVAEVEVDRKTGKIIVKHLWGAQDSGVVVNPASAENQIIGMLDPRRQPHARRGHVVLEEACHRPRLGDVSDPALQRHADRDPDRDLAHGRGHRRRRLADGHRRPALPRRRRVDRGAVPAAIGNAFFDATGVRMRQVPMTPVRVRGALAAAGRRARRRDAEGGRAPPRARPRLASGRGGEDAYGDAA